MTFYRFEDQQTTNGVRVWERKFELVKETPCGYWIKLYSCFSDTKWVSKNGKNRFAFPKREEALQNFQARKTRQVKILEARLNQAKIALSKVEGMINAEMENRSSSSELS